VFERDEHAGFGLDSGEMLTIVLGLATELSGECADEGSDPVPALIGGGKASCRIDDGVLDLKPNSFPGVIWFRKQGPEVFPAEQHVRFFMHFVLALSERGYGCPFLVVMIQARALMGLIFAPTQRITPRRLPFTLAAAELRAFV
jgi:hypothetical protein